MRKRRARRPTGYYWVKAYNSDKLEIAKYDPEHEYEEWSRGWPAGDTDEDQLEWIDSKPIPQPKR